MRHLNLSSLKNYLWRFSALFWRFFGALFGRVYLISRYVSAMCRHQKCQRCRNPLQMRRTCAGSCAVQACATRSRRVGMLGAALAQTICAISRSGGAPFGHPVGWVVGTSGCSPYHGRTYDTCTAHARQLCADGQGPGAEDTHFGAVYCANAPLTVPSI